MAIPASFRLASAVVAAVVAVGPKPALAENAIKVVMNEAKVLKLARPADTIIIGNPDIADATVENAETVVLTGKGFGVTNIVIIDTNGNALLDDRIVVSRSDDKTLRIYRQAHVTTLSCTPYCESAYVSKAEAASDAQAGN